MCRIKDTIEGFGALVKGELDDIPEQAFLYSGDATDVQRKAAELGR